MEVITRMAAAVFVLVAGLVHLQLWRSGYRAIPYIGPLFIANVVFSGILAMAVLLRRIRAVAIAGMVFSVASLAALVMSRTVGLLGFSERAWSDQALRATTAEVGATVAFAVLLVATARPRRTTLAPAEALGRKRHLAAEEMT